MSDSEIKNLGEPEKKSGTSYYFLFTLLIALSFFAAWIWWWQWGQYEVTTDDAYVGGNKVQVTNQVPGRVVTIYADDTQIVKPGQLLVSLDKSDFSLAFEKSKAALAQTVRDVRGMFELTSEISAEIKRQEAAYAIAVSDYHSRQLLVSSGAISAEELLHARAAVEQQEALLEALVFKLRRATSQVEGTTLLTHPLILKAADEVRTASLNLGRCDVRSPVEGMVAMRQIQVGETIGVASPLLTIIPLNELWVDANFKEKQLRKMKPSQSVTLTSDLYGSKVKYHGKIIGIGAGTGAVFSLLPPQNAAGNWVKIVQRVPVRISLDPLEVRSAPLRLGLSMLARVNLKEEIELSSQAGTHARKQKALFSTKLIDNQENVENLIKKILLENSGQMEPANESR